MNNIRWIPDQQNNFIQSFLLNNKFYEQEELEFMKNFIEKDDIILDLGANVGNHAVFYSKFTEAKTIYVIEPIPRNYEKLLCNLKLNYCDNVNVDYIGLAFGDRDCVGYPYMVCGKNEAGCITLYPEKLPAEHSDIELSPVRVISGDSIFENIRVDFIKMDVQGMELVALNGLEKTIKKSRPKIFIEIMNENSNEFDSWMSANNYRVHSKFPVGTYSNFMILPN